MSFAQNKTCRQWEHVLLRLALFVTSKNPTRGEHNLSLKGFPEECYVACLALLSVLDTPRIVCPSENPLDLQNIVSTEGNYLLTIIRYETPFLLWNMRRFDYLLTKPSE